jgi:hypothetical protein
MTGRIFATKRIAASILIVVLSFASALRADELPSGFQSHKFNPAGQDPTTDAGITSFHIDPDVCSETDYGDGRGESDCNNGNVRSNLYHQENMGIGQAVEYKFDIRIDPNLSYAGYENISANGIYPDGIDSHLFVATWQGPLLHNFLYILKADTTNGLDFLANQCQAPSDFGKWVTFSLKILWASDNKGWVEATCDGRTIYADEAIPTNQAPHCYESNQCEPWVEKNPDRFIFILGPMMEGFGPDWRKIPAATGLFTPIQEGGITIQIKNPTVTSGAVLYDDADHETTKQLQQRLIDLGCDPGPADGVNGAKTRAAALSCKQFPAGQMPPKLTIATLARFLGLYSAADAASLPAGTAPTEAGKFDAEFVVHVAEEAAMKTGHDVDVNSNIFGEIVGAPSGEDELSFILLGKFDYPNNDFFQLEFVIQDNLDQTQQTALKACGGRTLNFPDGSAHAHIKMKRADGGWLAPAQADCFLEALPGSQAAQVAFLFDHFRDIAIGMVNDETINRVRHDGVKIFLRRVAAGDVAVMRGAT